MGKNIMRIQPGILVSTVVLLLAASSGGWADEPAGQLIDSPYQAVEANAITLLLDGDGDVVKIQGEGCPGCSSASILPARDLVVEAGNRKLESREIPAYSGRSGVIHIYSPSGMAHRVSFSGYVDAGEGDQ
jgi:hypothetical protein